MPTKRFLSKQHPEDKPKRCAERLVRDKTNMGKRDKRLSLQVLYNEYVFDQLQSYMHCCSNERSTVLLQLMVFHSHRPHPACFEFLSETFVVLANLNFLSIQHTVDPYFEPFYGLYSIVSSFKKSSKCRKLKQTRDKGGNKP